MIQPIPSPRASAISYFPGEKPKIRDTSGNPFTDPNCRSNYDNHENSRFIEQREWEREREKRKETERNGIRKEEKNDEKKKKKIFV